MAVNRSYQVDYSTWYDSYIADALMTHSMQTKVGNPKVQLVKLVNEWALKWIHTCKEKDIAKAFKVYTNLNTFRFFMVEIFFYCLTRMVYSDFLLLERLA